MTHLPSFGVQCEVVLGIRSDMFTDQLCRVECQHKTVRDNYPCNWRWMNIILLGQFVGVGYFISYAR